MSTLLAFDWDAKGLFFVQAHVRGKQVRLTRAESIRLPEEIDSDDPAQVGRFLRAQLEELGVHVDGAVGCIERDEVVWHELRLPSSSPRELATMVHYQVTSELLPADEPWTYEYLLYPVEDGEGMRAVVAAAPEDRIQRIQQAAEAAGLKLQGIGWATLARHAARRMWAAPLERITTSPKETVEVLLARGDQFVEAVAVQGDQLLATQVVSTSSSQDEFAKLSTAAASRVGLQLLGRSLSADTYAVCAPAKSDGVGPLQEQLDKPLVAFDPLQGMPSAPSERWEALATLAGALAQQALGRDQAMDFLHPRRPAPPHPLEKYRLVIAAAAAALVLLVFVVRTVAALRDGQKELDRWRSAQSAANNELRQLRDYAKQQPIVADWLDRRVNWLEEYQRLLGALPDSSQLFLTRISFRQATVPGRRPVIHMEGFAASQETVAEVALQLASTGQYRVRPGGIVPAGSNANYPWRFEADLTLLPRSEADDQNTDHAASSGTRQMASRSR